MFNVEFTTKSGRVVGVTEFGDREAEHIVVMFHPAPGSSVFDPDPDATNAHAVRLIALDRPGYGVSEPVPADEWPSVDRAADDAAEYLAANGIGRVGAVGWSAGGREALALAARHPALVGRVAVVATPAPEEEVPWYGEAAAMVDALRGSAPDDAIETIAAQLGSAFGDEISTDALLAMAGASDADASVLADDAARARLVAMLQSSVAQGLIGIASDIAGYTLTTWGFRPGAVHAPALLLYGADDPAIGEAHARWWESALPNAEVELAPDSGHLVIVPQWSRVLDFVTQPAAR